MLEGTPCLIYGSGEQQRDFVYVGDVAAANLLALEQGSGRAYNIGTGQGTTVNQVFARLVEALDYTWQPEYRPSRPSEVHRIYLDCGRAARELGWQARISLGDGLRLTAGHFRKAAAKRQDVPLT